VRQPQLREVREGARILGIDPGSIVTGFGVVDIDGGRTTAAGWGTIRTAGEHSARLREIFERLGEVIDHYAPTEVAVEQVFMHRNADSALKLGQARAAALCATFRFALPIHEYSPRHIKKAVAGRGGAEKSQVEHMVRMILGVRGELEADAADALAAALCHAHQRDTNALLRRVAGAS
jgi:crossover junction endodeoxyribonuclease RuvC